MADRNADGWTDMKKPINSFHFYVNAPKTCLQLCHSYKYTRGITFKSFKGFPNCFLFV